MMGFLFIFSLATFNIFSSVHFNVLTVAYYEEFLLWSCLFCILCVSCVFLGRSFFSLGLFPSVITLKFWLWHSPGICLPYLCLSAKICSFHAFAFSQLMPVPFLSFKIVFTFFFCCLIFYFWSWYYIFCLISSTCEPFLWVFYLG